MIGLEDLGGLFQSLQFYDFKLYSNTSTKLPAYRESACMWTATEYKTFTVPILAVMAQLPHPPQT